MTTPNAQLLLSSRDRNVYAPIWDSNGNIFQWTLQGGPQPYNNFILSQPGENLIQGSIDKVQISEICFPYDIPNVQENKTDRFDILATNTRIPNTHSFTLIINQGFYSGSELATAITDAIDAELTPLGFTANELMDCTYNNESQTFTFSIVGGAGEQVSYQVTNTPAINPVNSIYPKTLTTIMGFGSGNANNDSGFIIGQINNEWDYTTSSAPLAFTQFIDICSVALTSAQSVRDGSTTQGANRRNLMVRLYVADESSTNSSQGVVPGTRPFVMHRQFRNAKIMPNVSNKALYQVDMQLFDDTGSPLTYAGTEQPFTAPRDFQITLNVYENKKKDK